MSLDPFGYPVAAGRPPTTEPLQVRSDSAGADVPNSKLPRHEPLLGRRVRCPRTEAEHRLNAGARPGKDFVCPGCGYWVGADGTTRWPSLTTGAGA